MSLRKKSLGSGNEPSLDEYINASNEAYSQPGVSTPIYNTYPPDLTPLTKTVGKETEGVFGYNKADGFYAVAFKTPNNNVLIAYEGTNFFTDNAQFTAGQVVDDADIIAGQLPPAFVDALKFEKTVTGMVGHRQGLNGVYITGHSLGAAEAEYVSAKTGLYGTTFGTPGISTNTPGLGKASFSSGHLTNYVEIGDPVGNYAVKDTSNILPAAIPDIVNSTSPNNQHFGVTKFIGYTNGTSIGAYASLTAANSFYKGGTETDVGLSAAALAAAVPDHFLTEYSYDLSAPLGHADHSFGANPVCFVTGTQIRTTRGECAVENLVVGDLAVTVSGDIRPIVWIGHRHINCRGRHELYPVRVAAHAFGADLPTRDLWLSPGHPVLVGAYEDNEGGHLVPIMCLINGTTISRVPVEAVTYWHVELDAHDILLADNLPAESYLDWGDRDFFRESSDHRIENPDFVVPGLTGRCRPVALDGPVIEAARRRLDAVFAMKLAAAAAWPNADDPLFRVGAED